MMHRVVRLLGAAALCAVACGVSYGEAAQAENLHEALGLEVPGQGVAAAGEPKLVDRTEGARGTLACPGDDGSLCQCPDFRTAYNVTTFTQYEKIYLDIVLNPQLFDLAWSEVYSGGTGAGIGDVTIAIFEDDNGLPGNLIWFGTSGTEFIINQGNTGDQLLGFDVYDMVAGFTGGGAGLPALFQYAGSCIHIGISHTNIPGGANAFWATSNSSIGDQRHYSSVGFGTLPSVTDITADDLQICLDLTLVDHILGPVLTNCPPESCALDYPVFNITFEGEATCGDPTDTVNGGCNSAPFATSTLGAGQYGVGSIFGIPDLDGMGNWSRDTDHWRITHDGGELTVGLYMDFVAFAFLVPASAACPYQAADQLFAVTVPECAAVEYSAGVQPAGDYILFIAQNPFADFRVLACGAGEYVIWDAGRDACPVDVTGDGVGDVGDFLVLSDVLKSSDTEIAPASDAWLCDLNNDGDIDLRDWTRFIADPCASFFNNGTASSITPTSVGAVGVDNSSGAGDGIDPARDATWDLTATVQESGGAMNAFVAAEMDAELTAPGFSFFQHAFGAPFQEPNPAFISIFPAVEFDTFVCSPGDLGDGITDTSVALSAPSQSFHEVSPGRIRVRWSEDSLRFNDDGTFARLTIQNFNGDGLLAELVPQGTRGTEQTVIGTVTGNVYFSATPDSPVAYAFDIVTNLDLVDPVCVADPVLDAGFCQCPDFSGAWNMTDFSTYEKVHIAAAGASLERLHWLGGYVDLGVPAGVRSEPGDVTIAMYTDGPDGFPLDLIYIGSDTQGDFVVTQELTNTPTAVSFGSIETYEMTAAFTTLPDLSAYAGSCVHVMIQMTDIPGGYIAAWGESNSALGDGQVLGGSGTNVLPDTIDPGGDAALCLDIIEQDHVIADVDNCPIVPLGCEGDANGDDVIDVNDISYVLFRLGDSGVPGDVDGDANGDGVVDVNDISYVLFRLGDPCPPW